jgi:hypothetical protein
MSRGYLCAGEVDNVWSVRYSPTCNSTFADGSPRSHTVFAESMRQMYKVADTVTPEDEQAFALYCFAFAQVF